MTPDLLPEKLAARIAVDDAGCWLWQGATAGKGYGGRSRLPDNLKQRIARNEHKKRMPPGVEP